MATYTKETALYDTGAIAGDIANAGQTATNYITYVSAADGIKVHNANDTSNYAQINSSGMDVVKNGTSVAKFGGSVRIGEDGNSGSHILVDSDSVDIHNSGLRNLEISGYTNADGVFGRLRLAPDSLSTGDGYARILGGRRSTPDRAEIRIETHIPDASDYAQLVISSSETKGPFVDVHGTFQTNGDVYVKSHSSPIGTVKTAQPSAAVSVPDKTFKALCSISLEAGTWMVISTVRAPSNATGFRMANLETTANVNACNACIPAVSANVTQFDFTRVVVPTATTTYYLNVYHNAGTSLSYPTGFTNYITAIRIL